MDINVLCSLQPETPSSPSICELHTSQGSCPLKTTKLVSKIVQPPVPPWLYNNNEITTPQEVQGFFLKSLLFSRPQDSCQKIVEDPATEGDGTVSMDRVVFKMDDVEQWNRKCVERTKGVETVTADTEYMTLFGSRLEAQVCKFND